MSTTFIHPPAPTPATKFASLAEWLHHMGDIPPDRIITNPWMGFATEQDFLTLVERDKRLCEFIDGTLVEKPVGSRESIIALFIATALNNFVRPRKLGLVSGEAGPIRTSTTRIRMPDVAFISIDDLPSRKLPDEPILSVPPSLAVEVISVGNTKAEMRQKVKEYFESGVRLVWLVYPKTRTIAVYEKLAEEPTRILGENERLDGASVLPGFSIPIAELFDT